MKCEVALFEIPFKNWEVACDDISSAIDRKTKIIDKIQCWCLNIYSKVRPQKANKLMRAILEYSIGVAIKKYNEEFDDTIVGDIQITSPLSGNIVVYSSNDNEGFMLFLEIR